MGPVTTTFSSTMAAQSIQIKSACGLIFDYIAGSKVRRAI